MKRIILFLLIFANIYVNTLSQDIDYWDTEKAFIFEKGDVTAYYLKEEQQYVAYKKEKIFALFSRNPKILEMPMKNPQSVFEQLQRDYTKQEFGPLEQFSPEKEQIEELE